MERPQSTGELVAPAGGDTLFLASTPLHTFFSLGLMRGPMREGRRTLFLINREPGEVDLLGQALAAADWPGVEVVEFRAMQGSFSARRPLDEITRRVQALAPQSIAIGNDHRLEFYAAIRGAPRARRIYIDDGLYSYLPHRHAKSSWRESLSDWRRGLKYGLSLERPAHVGGSRAVQSAYVLLPQLVHAGLQDKPVQAYLPEWFADPAVQQVCIAAAKLAGFDAQRCEALGLLVLLPHHRFLETQPELRLQLATLVRQHLAGGRTVALKSHPKATRPASELLGLADDSVVEVPARLPAEVLAPLLGRTQVVGTLTTALLSLVLLGRATQVYRLPDTQRPANDFEAGARHIYDVAGVKVFDAVPT